MLGAVAGDIIASPYEKKNAVDSEFEMFASVRGRHGGEDITFFPKVTDATVMTLAVARWIATDPEHRKGTFISCLQVSRMRLLPYHEHLVQERVLQAVQQGYQ